ncbi:MAG: hypothetical protein LBK12_07160 [Odoribacteraceae bacterium]|jgi:hypothetical protein|nr:hypothetical protein [Odoribacteraceae bacterium]
MTFLLILIAGVLAAALLLVALARPPGKAGTSPVRSPGCCGACATCEKTQRPPAATIEYFDDEELDAFRGASPDAYAPGEIDLFRDVLYTLRPGEIAAWLASLERRAIALPDPLRQEALAMHEESGGRRVTP